MKKYFGRLSCFLVLLMVFMVFFPLNASATIANVDSDNTIPAVTENQHEELFPLTEESLLNLMTEEVNLLTVCCATMMLASAGFLVWVVTQFLKLLTDTLIAILRFIFIVMVPTVIKLIIYLLAFLLTAIMTVLSFIIAEVVPFVWDICKKAISLIKKIWHSIYKNFTN